MHPIALGRYGSAWASLDTGFSRPIVDVLLPDLILIPIDALTEREGKSGVFVVAEGKLTFRAVESKAHDANAEQLRVLKGLDPGEFVVLSPSAELSEGLQVQVEGE